MSIKCPYCEIHEENRDEMWSHILTFHQDETKEKMQKKIEQHPIAFLKEAGFELELNRMAQGLCPLCGGVVGAVDLTGDALREWQRTGICGKCYESELGTKT